MSYLRFLCRFAHSCVQHILTMRVPRLMSIRYRNCLLFVGAWVHPLVFDGVRCSSRPPGFIPWILMGSVALRGRLGLSPEFWWGPLLFAVAWVHPLVFDGVRFSSRPPGFITWFLMGPVALRGRLCSSPGFWWGPCCSQFWFSVLCYFFCFVCIRPVSCILNVASFSGLSILGCLFCFL